MKHRMISGVCIDLSEIVCIGSYNTGNGFVVAMKGGRNMEMEEPKQGQGPSDRNELAKAIVTFKEDYKLLCKVWMNFGDNTSMDAANDNSAA